MVHNRPIFLTPNITMSFRVDSKKETPRKLSTLIAQLWFIHSKIISPTQSYSYNLHFFCIIALDKIKLKKKIFEIFLL